MVELLHGIDLRIRSSGDYKALFYLEQREKDKADLVHEGLVYRRDADEKLIILFTKPKTEAGKGYLRIDKNLGTTIRPLANGSAGLTASASRARIRVARILTSRNWRRNTIRNSSEKKSSGISTSGC